MIANIRGIGINILKGEKPLNKSILNRYTVSTVKIGISPYYTGLDTDFLVSGLLPLINRIQMILFEGSVLILLLTLIIHPILLRGISR